MKTKETISTKKRSVAVRDLKTMKNPKGGISVAPADLNGDGRADKIRRIGSVTLVR